MKKGIIFTASLLVTAGAFAQGTVNVNNFQSGSLRAPVYGPELGNSQTQIKGQGPAPSIPAGATVYTGQLLAGTGFTVSIWGIGSASYTGPGSLQLMATTTFRTGTGAGLLNTAGFPAGNFIIPVAQAPADGTIATAGSKVTLQLRAWQTIGNDPNNAAVNNWANALAMQASNPAGSSDAFSPPPDVGGAGQPPAGPPIFTGLTSFNIYTVPEPSLIALGALGLGALLLRRRKA
jgi:hypothetical protein